MRRRQQIDNRPDWRDPDMPVLMMAVVDNKVQLYPCRPEHVTQYYTNKIARDNYMEPDWRNDPSYNWSKSKSKGQVKC